MELKTKRQMNGKSIAVFDTKGMNIVDIVDEMVSDGWTFEKLTVTYENNMGGKSTKDVEPQNVKRIFDKFHFEQWNFRARRQGQIIAGSVFNSKNTAAISESRGGAINAFVAIGGGHMPEPQRPESQPEQPRRKPQIERGYIPQEDDIYARRETARAAAASLYDDDDDTVPGISRAQREAKREELRANDEAAIAQVSQKKHTGLLILSIVEILLVASIFCGIIGLVDSIAGRKRVATDPQEAAARFKLARAVLILGIVVDIICLAISVWKFGPIIMMLLS